MYKSGGSDAIIKRHDKMGKDVYKQVVVRVGLKIGKVGSEKRQAKTDTGLVKSDKILRDSGQKSSVS